MIKCLENISSGEVEQEATNILTNIKKLKKGNPDSVESYERLSEQCHPNYGGFFDLYATLHDDSNCISFEVTEKYTYTILDATMEVKKMGKCF